MNRKLNEAKKSSGRNISCAELHEIMSSISTDLFHRSDVMRQEWVFRLLKHMEDDDCMLNDVDLSQFVTCLQARLEGVNAEPCEEIRVQLLRILAHTIFEAEQIRIPDFIIPTRTVLTSCLQDLCADVRHEALCAIERLWKHNSCLSDDTICDSLSNLLESVVHNTRHKQARIRERSFTVIPILFSVSSKDSLMEMLVRALFAGGHDTSSTVRKAVVDCCTELLYRHSWPEERLQIHQMASCLVCRLGDGQSEIRSITRASLIQLGRKPPPGQGLVVIDDLKLSNSFVDYEELGSVLRNPESLGFLESKATRCIELAIEILKGKHSSDNEQHDALHVLHVFGVFTNGSNLMKSVKALGAFVSESKFHDVIEKIMRVYLLVHPLGTLVQNVGSAMKGEKETCAMMHILLSQGSVASVDEESVEAVLEYAEKASGWPHLRSWIVKSMEICFLGNSSFLTSIQRKRLFQVLVLCLENEAKNMDLAEKILGKSVFDDVYDDANGSSSGDLKILKALISHADQGRLERSFGERILPVIVECSENENIETVMDGLELVYIASSRKIQISEEVSERIIRVFCNHLRWLPGNARSKLRKLTLVCLRKFFALEIAVKSCDSFANVLVDRLKECSDDCWSPDNRLLAVLALQELMKDDSWKTMLVPILKARLDDTNEVVRTYVMKLLTCE